MSRRWLLLAFVPIFLILAVAAYLTVVFAYGERSEQGWVIHTYQVMDSLRALTTDIADTETSQRGYLLTRNSSFLTSYNEAQARMQSDFKRFKFLTQDNVRQQSRAETLSALIGERLSVLHLGLSAANQSEIVGAPMLALLDRGTRTENSLTAVITLALNEEQQLLRERIDARHAVERSEIISSITGAALTLIALLAAAIWLVRDNAKLQVSEALRRRQARILQATLDNIRDGILVFDETDHVAAFNNAFFRLMDFPERLAAIGATLGVFRDFDVSEARRSVDQVILDRKSERFVRRQRELEVYRALIPGEGFLVAASDVTARVRAEEVVRQSQKMDAIGQLTGGVAHDFNNLLQVIGSNLDLAMTSVMADAKMAERLQNAISAVERGSRLTAQLLAFARRQVLEPRSVNLSRLVREITDLLRRTLGEHVEIECVIGGGLWNVLVDPAQVENAIINLAINSRDAMPDGGKLTIEISNAFLDDEYAARHFEVAAGQYVALAVSDTGAGMPPEIIARVFDPFFTTKPEGKGTGLGLSQVHGFVKQSGGHIKIYSEPGRGTTVKLYLPRTRKPQELQEPIIPTANIVGGSETILVVEDDENVRGAAIDILTDLGYAVLKAENADQALAILKSGARVDLLFTDVVMPGSLNARDFTRLAEKLCPKMRILYSSGYTQNAIVHNGQLDDNISLLGKPYRKDILALKIRSLLDGSPENSFAPEPTVMSNAQLITKVLIVEDVSLIRMTTVDMIEEIGLVALQASNGPDALKILRADSEIGVLLTDLGLPGMSGNELIDEALKLRPDLRIVIASGRLTAEGAEASRANVVRLSKPFNSSDLKRALGA